jgi:hypothetical protein
VSFLRRQVRAEAKGLILCFLQLMCRQARVMAQALGAARRAQVPVQAQALVLRAA